MNFCRYCCTNKKKSEFYFNYYTGKINQNKCRKCAIENARLPKQSLYRDRKQNFVKQVFKKFSRDYVNEMYFKRFPDCSKEYFNKLYCSFMVKSNFSNANFKDVSFNKSYDDDIRSAIKYPRFDFKTEIRKLNYNYSPTIADLKNNPELIKQYVTPTK